MTNPMKQKIIEHIILFALFASGYAAGYRNGARDRSIELISATRKGTP